ncbi:multifunctional CCA tRNA nucleotidyl transferase/2'3'-cyclic phosphodiesterase/2'nucleotidase/phosphatase [Caedibacter taeniospiralis]|uniref:multifunctional CCA tRNA nucleotidyl transferase/2'3'-cyclic phosphodiesterase/2'nucleotidase/phosphatase n=1 Tax=Caedibacter taeniospiralis TaxID=28907 RepID=UPI000C2704FE|nr:multifunctional CCA tRNA nucleotidyl transferase/2'3'-cyclic phosphodiesterase/2'nucleotidase/phosphatase [Caedibacter taeniospiralis]
MEIYLVGGAVRDKLLGLNIEDKDWLVINGSEQEMLEKGFIQVGKKFPVFLHPKTYEEYALARTEDKIDKGYKGFQFNTDDVSLVADLKRRDLTINAMAIDENGILHDPFNGQKDIIARKLRHVSDAFSEDPLRVLRVARFAAKYHYLGFTIATETLKLMQKIVENKELESLSSERIFQELVKSLATPNPEVFIFTLQQVNACQHILKALNSLNKDDLRALVYAKQGGCQDVNVLSALILNHLLTEQALSNTLDELKVPRAMQTLCLNVYRYRHFFASIRTQPEKDTLSALKAINALRDNGAFEQFITALQYIYHENTASLSSLKCAKNIQYRLITYDYALLINDVRNKKTIANKIEQQQLMIIKNTIAENLS